MCGGWLIGSSVTRAQGWGGGLSLYFVRAAELACFHDFCRHLLTNPVRYIYALFRCGEWISKSAQLLEEHCILIETSSGLQE